MAMQKGIEDVKRALVADDIDAVAQWLQNNPNAVRQHEAQIGGCRPALAGARSCAAVDLLVNHGASLAKFSEWAAPGFWLDDIPTKVAQYLVELGATLSAHAAAGLGLDHELALLLDKDSSLVNAKGGDGCRPLHFSRTVGIARMLVERGAELDARDDDHNSTAAQWRIGTSPDVTRLLLERGAMPDIFMAAGLGDFQLTQQIVRENPACTTYRIGTNSGPFPGIGFHSRGGTIYQWTLGFNQSPQEVADRRGFHSIYEFLMEHTPAREKFLVACMQADRAVAEELLEENPSIVRGLREEELALLAKSCWETNLNIEAVRLMLDLGFPVDAPEFNHGYKPLHNAAFCGDSSLVKLLIDRGHPVNDRDPTHHGTPLGWAIHSYTQARRHPEGDFPEVIRLLLRAGATLDEKIYPTGEKELDDAIRSELNGK